MRLVLRLEQASWWAGPQGSGADGCPLAVELGPRISECKAWGWCLGYGAYNDNMGPRPMYDTGLKPSGELGHVQGG